MIQFEKHLDKFYMYKAHCTKCYDGDTCTLNVDLGFGISMSKKTCRLYGINTPEITKGSPEDKAKAVIARDFLRSYVLDKDLILYTIKDNSGKYGRLLGILFTVDDKGEPDVNLNQLMIDKSYAVEYDV